MKTFAFVVNWKQTETGVKLLFYTAIYTVCRLFSSRNFVCRKFVWKLSAENFCRKFVWKTCKIRRYFSVYKKNLCRLYTNFLYTDFWWWILLCRAPIALFLHFVSSKWISYIVVTWWTNVEAHKGKMTNWNMSKLILYTCFQSYFCLLKVCAEIVCWEFLLEICLKNL